MLDKSAVIDLLNKQTFDFLPADIQLASCIQNVQSKGEELLINIVFPFPTRGIEEQLTTSMQALIKQAAPNVNPQIDIRFRIKAYETKAGVPPLAKVKNILALASGKGGVGKSTSSVNLALALSYEGARVGLLDADIYGPSVPIMLGISGAKPISEDQKTILPIEAHGIKTMSIGFLVEDKQAMVWRGPMASSALQQIVRDTRWGELDYLIIDLPPGTGDIQLTMAQKIPVTAAVIVTTPQDLALADAKKAVAMFEKVKIPVMGIIENMSTHICSQCGHQEAIFGSDGGRLMAQEYQIPLLGQLPLAMSIRQSLDQGKPSIAVDPQSTISQTYRRIARDLAASLNTLAKDYSKGAESIAVKSWQPG